MSDDSSSNEVVYTLPEGFTGDLFVEAVLPGLLPQLTQAIGGGVGGWVGHGWLNQGEFEAVWTGMALGGEMVLPLVRGVTPAEAQAFAARVSGFIETSVRAGQPAVTLLPGGPGGDVTVVGEGEGEGGTMGSDGNIESVSDDDDTGARLYRVALEVPEGFPGELYVDAALPAVMPHMIAALGAGDPMGGRAPRSSGNPGDEYRWSDRGWRSQNDFEVQLRQGLLSAEGEGSVARGQTSAEARDLRRALAAHTEVRITREDDDFELLEVENETSRPGQMNRGRGDSGSGSSGDSTADLLRLISSVAQPVQRGRSNSAANAAFTMPSFGGPEPSFARHSRRHLAAADAAAASEASSVEASQLLQLESSLLNLCTVTSLAEQRGNVTGADNDVTQALVVLLASRKAYRRSHRREPERFASPAGLNVFTFAARALGNIFDANPECARMMSTPVCTSSLLSALDHDESLADEALGCLIKIAKGVRQGARNCLVIDQNPVGGLLAVLRFVATCADLVSVALLRRALQLIQLICPSLECAAPPPFVSTLSGLVCRHPDASIRHAAANCFLALSHSASGQMIHIGPSVNDLVARMPVRDRPSVRECRVCYGEDKPDPCSFRARVRSRPSFDAPELCALVHGTVLKVIGAANGEGWVRVAHPEILLAQEREEGTCDSLPEAWMALRWRGHDMLKDVSKADHGSNERGGKEDDGTNKVEDEDEDEDDRDWALRVAAERGGEEDDVARALVSMLVACDPNAADSDSRSAEPGDAAFWHLQNTRRSLCMALKRIAMERAGGAVSLARDHGLVEALVAQLRSEAKVAEDLAGLAPEDTEVGDLTTAAMAAAVVDSSANSTPHRTPDRRTSSAAAGSGQRSSAGTEDFIQRLAISGTEMLVDLCIALLDVASNGRRATTLHPGGGGRSRIQLYCGEAVTAQHSGGGWFGGTCMSEEQRNGSYLIQWNDGDAPQIVTRERIDHGDTANLRQQSQQRFHHNLLRHPGMGLPEGLLPPGAAELLREVSGSSEGGFAAALAASAGIRRTLESVRGRRGGGGFLAAAGRRGRGGRGRGSDEGGSRRPARLSRNMEDAIRRGSLSALQRIISDGADVDTPSGESGDPPIVTVVSMPTSPNTLNMLELLLSCNADPNQQGASGTALEALVRRCSRRSGGGVSGSDLTVAQVVEDGGEEDDLDAAMLQHLLDAGADPNISEGAHSPFSSPFGNSERDEDAQPGAAAWSRLLARCPPHALITDVIQDYIQDMGYEIDFDDLLHMSGVEEAIAMPGRQQPAVALGRLSPVQPSLPLPPPPSHKSDETPSDRAQDAAKPEVTLAVAERERCMLLLFPWCVSLATHASASSTEDNFASANSASANKSVDDIRRRCLMLLSKLVECISEDALRNQLGADSRQHLRWIVSLLLSCLRNTDSLGLVAEALRLAQSLIARAPQMCVLPLSREGFHMRLNALAEFDRHRSDSSAADDTVDAGVSMPLTPSPNARCGDSLVAPPMLRSVSGATSSKTVALLAMECLAVFKAAVDTAERDDEAALATLNELKAIAISLNEARVAGKAGSGFGPSKRKRITQGGAALRRLAAMLSAEESAPTVHELEESELAEALNRYLFVQREHGDQLGSEPAGSSWDVAATAAVHRNHQFVDAFGLSSASGNQPPSAAFARLVSLLQGSLNAGESAPLHLHNRAGAEDFGQPGDPLAAQLSQSMTGLRALSTSMHLKLTRLPPACDGSDESRVENEECGEVGGNDTDDSDGDGVDNPEKEEDLLEEDGSVEERASINSLADFLGVDSDPPLLRESSSADESSGGRRLMCHVILGTGAVCRSGPSIDDDAHVCTLPQGYRGEVFEEAMFDGIRRLRVAEGWISERLRGGQEEHVVELADVNGNDDNMGPQSVLTGELWFQAHPLTEFKELENHVLRHVPPRDEAYLAFCRGLVGCNVLIYDAAALLDAAASSAAALSALRLARGESGGDHSSMNIPSLDHRTGKQLEEDNRVLALVTEFNAGNGKHALCIRRDRSRRPSGVSASTGSSSADSSDRRNVIWQSLASVGRYRVCRPIGAAAAAAAAAVAKAKDTEASPTRGLLCAPLLSDRDSSSLPLSAPQPPPSDALATALPPPVPDAVPGPHGDRRGDRRGDRARRMEHMLRLRRQQLDQLREEHQSHAADIASIQAAMAAARGGGELFGGGRHAQMMRSGSGSSGLRVHSLPRDSRSLLPTIDTTQESRQSTQHIARTDLALPHRTHRRWLRVISAHDGGALMRDGPRIDTARELGVLSTGSTVRFVETCVEASVGMLPVVRYRIASCRQFPDGGWLSEKSRLPENSYPIAEEVETADVKPTDLRRHRDYKYSSGRGRNVDADDNAKHEKKEEEDSESDSDRGESDDAFASDILAGQRLGVDFVWDEPPTVVVVFALEQAPAHGAPRPDSRSTTSGASRMAAASASASVRRPGAGGRAVPSLTTSAAAALHPSAGSVRYSIGGNSYTIDWSTSEQVNLKYRTRRKVRRGESGNWEWCDSHAGMLLGATWRPFASDVCAILDRGHELYQQQSGGDDAGDGSAESPKSPSGADDAELMTRSLVDPASLVGERVSVKWAGPSNFYDATIVAYNSETGVHRLNYDDGDVRNHNLKQMTWRSAGAQKSGTPLASNYVVWPNKDTESQRQLVGKQILVRWAHGKHFSGEVTDFDAESGQHTVVYADGDVRRYDMARKTWCYDDGTTDLAELASGSPAEMRMARLTSTASGRGDPAILLNCPSGHGLRCFSTPNATFQCDACGRSGFGSGTVMYGCRQCNWDACTACFSAAEELARAAEPSDAKQYYTALRDRMRLCGVVDDDFDGGNGEGRVTRISASSANHNVLQAMQILWWRKCERDGGKVLSQLPSLSTHSYQVFYDVRVAGGNGDGVREGERADLQRAANMDDEGGEGDPCQRDLRALEVCGLASRSCVSHALLLIRALFEVASSCASARASNGHPAVLPARAWVCRKLERKLALQLSDALSIACHSLPLWVTTVLRHLRCFFLLSLSLRARFLLATSFGACRAVQWLQASPHSVSAAGARERIGSLRHHRVSVARDNVADNAAALVEFHAVRREVLEVEFEQEAGVGIGVTRSFYSAVADAFVRRGINDATPLWFTDEQYTDDAVSGETVGALGGEGISGGGGGGSSSGGNAKGNRKIATRALDDCEGGSVASDESPRRPPLAPFTDEGNNPTKEVLEQGEAEEKAAYIQVTGGEGHASLFPRPSQWTFQSGGGTGDNAEVLSACCDRFRFLGAFCAKALMDEHLVPLPISPVFLQLVQEVLSRRHCATEPSAPLPARAADPYVIFDQIGGAATDMLRRMCEIASHITHAEAKADAALFAVDEDEDNKGGDDGADSVIGAGEFSVARQRARSELSDSVRSDLASSLMKVGDWLSFGAFVDPLTQQTLWHGSAAAAADEAVAAADDEEAPAISVDNVREYVDAVAQAWCGGVARQVGAFADGVALVMSTDPTAFCMFSPRELKEILCGELDPSQPCWSRAELDAHVVPGYMYTQDSQPFRWLLETIDALEPHLQRQFLAFVTGSPALPVGGLAGLAAPLTVDMSEAGPDALPTARTCSLMLRLPSYKSKHVLCEKLKAAMGLCKTFEMA